MYKRERPTLDDWIGRKMGLEAGRHPERVDIKAYQLRKLNEVLKLAYEHSAFYREVFGRVKLESLNDMAELPFTTPNDLKKDALKMLCVAPYEISRIVTLETSGSTGGSKRVYFTDEDLELCIDFFHNGMQNLVDKNDKVGILFPAQRPGSVGDLLQKALERLGAGSVRLCDENTGNKNALLQKIAAEKISSLVGAPELISELAHISSEKESGLRLSTVLLSSDFVSDEHRKVITDAWNCEVFEHYGLTEGGLGFGVSCYAQEGYHVREADLYVEIIDPQILKPVPEGREGEIVFTTLTRKGMPFLRYRTGDISRWVTKDCPCGTVLKLLGRVGDRGIPKGGFAGGN